MTTSIVSPSIPTTATTTTTTTTTSTPEVTDLAPPPSAPTPAPEKPSERDLHDAYLRVEPECGGLTPEQLAGINVDVSRVVAIVHASLPRLLALRDVMARLPAFDIANLDRLEDYILALRYADVLYRTGRQVAAPATELAARTTRARDALLVNAQPLVHAGIVAPEDVADMAKSTGYTAVAEEVLRLVVIYRRVWPAIAGRTLVTAAQLDTAADLATSLLAAVEQRDHAPVVIPAPVLNRQRIFTLFRRAYDEVRRALIFLRAPEGDADEILPSIYNRGARYSGTRPADADASGEGAVAASPVASATPAHPATPTTTTATTARPIPQNDPFGRA